MNNKYLLLIFLINITVSNICSAQETIVYKQIDSTKLFMDVYYPEKVLASKTHPAMVFFFGGGWKGGTRSQFTKHAEYFSKRGIICFLADYRTENKNKTSPYESLKDAKTAIRFIRKYSERFHVDSTKIIASGGSAGGHLAAATALIQDYNEETDDLSINCKPNALVLFNPVIDNGPGGYGYERIGNNYKKFSPLHNIKKGAPPTIIFLGTKDKLIPVVTAKYYKNVMNQVESRCDLKLYEGQKHGFFNYRNFELYKATVTETDKFLVSLGYLGDYPKVIIE